MEGNTSASWGTLVVRDIRVARQARGRGTAARLMRAAEGSAQRHSCRELEAQTQDINLAACRLHGARGFRLAEASPGACPGETQLIWRKLLAPPVR